MKRSRESRYRRFRKLSAGDFPAATIRHGRRYLADYPEHGYAWYLLTNALIELGRYEEAEQASAKAMELCPEDRRHFSLAQRGHIFKASGDYEQAAEWYRRAIEADPDDADSSIYLGGVLARQGRLIEAEEIHRSAITCGKGCIDEAYLNLALVLRARERFDEAAECLREALRIDPEYREARRVLRDIELCRKL